MQNKSNHSKNSIHDLKYCLFSQSLNQKISFIQSGVEHLEFKLSTPQLKNYQKKQDKQNKGINSNINQNISQNFLLLFTTRNLQNPGKNMNFQFSKQFSETSLSCQEIIEKPSKERKGSLWTIEENLIYIQFLKTHREIFITEEIRRHNKVFIQLAKLMPSRTSDQCRSHHQKMMISHKSIDKIIKHLNKKIAKWQKKQKKQVLKPQFVASVELKPETVKIDETNDDLQKLEIDLKNFQFPMEEDLWNVLA